MGFFSGIRRRIKKIIPKEIRPFVPYAAALIPGLQGIGGLSAAKSRFLTSAITRGLIDDEADLKDVATAGIMSAAPVALEGYVQGLPQGSKTLEFLQKGKEGERITDYISKYANPSGLKDVATVVGGQAAIDAGMQAAEAADDAEKEEDRKSKEFKAKRRQQIKDMFISNGYSEEETEEMLTRYGYARGGDVEEFEVEEMDEEILTPFDLKQEEGVPIGPMAGPCWYTKRIENLEFLGYSYEEAAEIAFDSDKYYEIIGMEEPMSKQDALGGVKRMASNPSPEAERNDAAMSLFGRPLEMLNQMELEQLDEYVRSMMAKGGKVMQKASMTGFGKKYEEWLRKNKPELFVRKEEKNKKTEKKASGGRIGFDKGGISEAAGSIVAQLVANGTPYEVAIEMVREEFPDKSAEERELDKKERLEEYRQQKQDEEEDAISSNLGIAASGLEQAFGRPFGNAQPTPMLRFARGGDVEDVEMMDEEFVGDDELRMEEGVQIGPMAEEGETDVEVLMAMKVSPGLIDEYRNYVFELKELGMEHQIVPFREWFNTTYGAARMGVKKGGKIIKIMPEGVLYKGKAKDYPGIKQLIKDMKKKGTRKGKADGGLMNLGGNEMDLRGGGFVPMGAKERADDVPARLSKNEFVFTADAVRAAGGGSVDKGADLMYDTMKKLEAQV